MTTTTKFLMAAAVLAVTGTAQARDKAAERSAVITAAGTVVAADVGRPRNPNSLSQRYCIVEPTMRSAALARVCHSLAEWQVQGIDPRRLPRP